MKNQLKDMDKNNLKAVDFFCGGGGMTYGLKQAGIEVIAGLDIDIKCKETYEYNNSPAEFICTDIKELQPQVLEKRLGIKINDGKMVFIGCSPCQYWSVINTEREGEKEGLKQGKDLLRDFQKFVEYFLPGTVIIENVQGLLTKAGSPLNDFIHFLNKNEYHILHKKVEKVTAFGVPQTRKRFLLVASRVVRMGALSISTIFKQSDLTVKNFIGTDKFPPIPAGYIDHSSFMHTTAGLKDINLKRLLKTTQNGGSRLDWENDEELMIDAYRKLKNANSKFKDNYSRMSWDKPAPTITTKFFSISNGRFAHPEQNRAISIREGATLQTFPFDFILKTKSISDTARIIGNAVPPRLAEELGKAIIKLYQNA